ncbi:MAG: hypothetical protein J6B51_10110 [Clostridia bacterium]|nr:hypothetical protein [Clostridia bacterium]
MTEKDPKSTVMKKIADAITAEMNKPDNEIDWEYIELCEKTLAAFTEYKKPSKRKFLKRINRILKRGEVKKEPASEKFIFKPSFGALLASLVLVLSCFAVFATPIGKNLFGIFSDDGIIYINNGEQTVHRSLEDLIEAENLNFYYPEEFAYDAQISQICRDGEGHIVFVFDDPRLSFEVYDSSEDSSQNISGAMDFYNMLCSTDCTYLTFSINNDLYNLSCDSRELMNEMMNSFDFER